ncbi:MAG: tetratricopeptide repeat protein [Vicinamibacteria bacterium]
MIGALVMFLLVNSSPERLQAEQHLKAGQEFLASERYEQALASFQQAIKLDPLMIMAHYGAGQSHMALKDYTSAVTSFERARSAFKERSADIISIRLENDRAREDRIIVLKDKIRENQERSLSPNSTAARERDRRTQEWEMEIQRLQRVERIGTALELPAGLSLALGSAYFRSGQLKDAEREYRAAIDVQPKLGEPRNNLAVVLLLTGRPADANAQVKLAEKSGFKVPPGLKQDIDKALAVPAP